jgi:hypothetical protein
MRILLARIVIDRKQNKAVEVVLKHQIWYKGKAQLSVRQFAS